MSPLIRLLIADDHPLVRAGLKAMLAGDAGMEVIAEAATGTDVVAMARALRPDLVLMDLHMPELDGATATAMIRERNPEIQVMVLTTYDSDADIRQAIEAGATGYLLKDAGREELFSAVRSAARGKSVLSPSIASRVLGQLQVPADQTLTDRESQILTAVAQGLTNKEVARELRISEATVKTHLLHVFAKLGVDDRTAAATLALRRGIICLDQ
ncbi:MAG TPA: response regulator transcription factor [Actinomycetota bacterium]|nr:response regulator transcription factor [Actinomycetota bacterium]